MSDHHAEAIEQPAPLVATRDDLEAVAAWLADAPQVALDTEANSMHAYRERTCIVQVTAGGRNAILDVLALDEDLGPVREALDRADVEVVLHGGDYDIRMLTREHDFSFHRVFDTMIAATLLGEEKVGLANLVEDAYGVKLDKRFQKADWAKRPLTDAHLDYLRRDTIYLPGLRERLGERLAEADLEEEAAIEFRRLAALEGEDGGPDLERWRRAKGARRLDDRGRAILRALWLWREGEAERRDRPPFKVVSPRSLVALAAKPPRDPRRVEDLEALHGGERRRYGRPLLEALRQGLADAEAGRIPERDPGPRPSSEERRRAKADRALEDAIKAWRRKEARRREVPNVVVLPNPALQWIVRTRPRDADALAACEDIGPKRLARYGDRLLELVDRAPTP